MSPARPLRPRQRLRGRGAAWAWLLALAGSAGAQASLPPVPPAAPAPGPRVVRQQGFDPLHTRFSFELRTRWGQKVEGEFPRYDGEVNVLADGRHQVRIRLATGEVVVGGSERYTRMARSDRFFAAQRYPYIEFLSEPHPADLARTGGALRGRLTLHGISRMETFVLGPAACARPGEDCDAIAHGSVSRDDYALDGWQFALGNRVRFTMQVRLESTQNKPLSPRPPSPRPPPSAPVPPER
ncbi:YceI like family [Lysobacter enzymogenes]|uniref:YceI like family n=1 Tax=Lysobacter enzymogenes TaxID=69 RepID=A0A0S2DPQ0_LYSEN|nr:YceI family protein [Lysobacter enzymogenes]ALN60522.1 YceI like family [Lysobacter enzymogenes]